MIFYSLILVIIFFIYRPWFEITKTLSSGDWPYLFSQNIQAFKIPIENSFLWLEPYYQITAKLGVHFFSLAWEITEKVFWFYPFLIISTISSYLFLKYLTKELGINKDKLIFISLGSLIFITNTYILMLAGGGQMGVCIAYAFAPLVLLRIIRTSEFKIRNLILSSLILGLQLMFDPRIFILTIIIGFGYFLFTQNFQFLKRTLLILAISIALNIFWILPNLSFFNSEYRVTVNALTASYLSFATFSNSISLLHPNWPENIFGKIGFMKPEFIVLPIIAFSSLFFVKKNKKILFFALLGILGTFFAKGTNSPFGELYQFLSTIPGFMIFRDPTKFYALTILSYMVLIPYCLLEIFKKITFAKYYLLGIFLIFWLFIIRSAVFGQSTGTFKPSIIPEEYVVLRNFLVNENDPFVTLWIPDLERFGFSSNVHPAISSMGFFEATSLSEVLNKLDEPNAKDQLKRFDVKYIIVPYDYLKEIFLIDRKYDERLYTKTINKLKNIPWLSNLKNNFGKIKVFEVVY